MDENKWRGAHRGAKNGSPKNNRWLALCLWSTKRALEFCLKSSCIYQLSLLVVVVVVWLLCLFSRLPMPDSAGHGVRVRARSLSSLGRALAHSAPIIISAERPAADTKGEPTGASDKVSPGRVWARARPECPPEPAEFTSHRTLGQRINNCKRLPGCARGAATERAPQRGPEPGERAARLSSGPPCARWSWPARWIDISGAQ